MFFSIYHFFLCFSMYVFTNYEASFLFVLPVFLFFHLSTSHSLALMLHSNKRGNCMKEYKAVYNETLDTVTFFDENGEKHELYTHTREDENYLNENWLNIAYTKILNFIIIFMFPAFFLGIVFFFSTITNRISESQLSILWIVIGYFAMVLFAWVFFAMGIHALIKSGMIFNSRKFAFYAKEGKNIFLMIFAFLITIVLTIFISLIGHSIPY